MIIKNGEMNLLVADTDRAVEYITGVAVDLGGYLISSRMWQADGFKLAQVTMAIPSEQALAVNNHLTDVEAELEQVKGRMQYLRERAAYSTLTVNVEPQRPTPTPAPTATPIVWQPEKTVAAASDRLSSMLRGLGDLLIWLGITIAPFAIPAALISAGAWHWKRKQKKS